MTRIVILLTALSYFTLLSVSADDWPQVQKNPQHTGYSPEVLGTNFRVAWTHPFQPDRIFPQVQAIVYQGKVFIGTEGANGQKPTIYAFDKLNGRQAWRYEVGGPILNSVAADNGRIYFGSLDGAVYALNSESGALIWKKQLSGRFGFSAAPVVADNKVMLGGQNGNFYALNPADGNVIWQYHVGRPILQTAAFNQNKVFFGAMDMSVYALNTSPVNPTDPSTILAWKSPKIDALAFKDYWPVVSQGKVFIAPMSKYVDPGIAPGYPWGWHISTGEEGTFWSWLNTNGPAIASGNMAQVPNLMTSQDSIMASFQANPNNFHKNLYILDENTGQETTVVPHVAAQTHSGTTTPPCVGRDNNLVVPIMFIASGWGRLDLSLGRLIDIFYDGTNAQGQPISPNQAPAGFGNWDENLNVTCTANLILGEHVWEDSATYNGAYNLDTREWTRIPYGYANRQMSTNTQGGGGNPFSVSEGMIYHVAWHELIARTTN